MTNDTSSPPVLDLAAPEPEIKKALAAACADWGFFQVTNHGVPTELLQSTLAISKAFFAQPLDEKQAHCRTKEQPWGYYDRELTKNLRDRKEIFDFGSGFSSNSGSEQSCHHGNKDSIPWPRKLPAFESLTREFSTAAHALGVRVSVLIAQALDLSTQAALNLQDQHSSFTRLNHYPVEDLLEHTTAPPTGPFGISHHTDAGALTVLLQDAVSGLQMQHQEDWIDVPTQQHTLTLNIGDMFQVWANDRITAPVHRVLASTTAERFSIAYFLNPGQECVIAPLLPPGSEQQARYEPIHWAEFRGLRALGDYGNYGEEIQISHYRR